MYAALVCWVSRWLVNIIGAASCSARRVSLEGSALMPPDVIAASNGELDPFEGVDFRSWNVRSAALGLYWACF